MARLVQSPSALITPSVPAPAGTGLADALDGTLVHLNHRDVTLICLSRAPIERLTAYEQRMGWQFPYLSTYGTDREPELDRLRARGPNRLPHLHGVGARPIRRPVLQLSAGPTPKAQPAEPRSWRKDEYPD
jgi:hypothetical protein